MAGTTAATSVVTTPATIVITTVPALEREAARRDAEAERVEQRPDADRQPDAAEQTEQRADHADDERLDEHHPRHLPAARADGTQQRVLALALRGA